MSRIMSVCLCAVVAFVTLFGAPLVRPAAVHAASGTLGMETPLHESPEHGAPLIALLPEGTIVSIDGPPVAGFYPVSTGGLSGWMRGETLLLEKDDPNEGGETDPSLQGQGQGQETDGLVPVEQTATGDTAPAETPATLDPASDPMPIAEPTGEAPVAGDEWTEPAGDVTYDDQNGYPLDPVADAPAAVYEPAPMVEPVPADAAPAPAPELASDAKPVPVAPDSETPPAESASSAPGPAAEPALDPNVTPIPVPAPSPVGPASVIVDAPIRTGPGSWFDLIFTVPMGSTLQQTGHVVDGYVTVQYKEVTGWAALEHLGMPSTFVAETPPGEMGAPVETAPIETEPIETTPVEADPVETAPVEAAPVETTPVETAPVNVKASRPGSGVAFTTVDMSLRAGPSAVEEPVTVVPAGSRVVLTGVMEGGFQRVTYKDQLGWIADEYLQSPPNPAPDSGNSGNQQQYSRKQVVRIINGAADRYGQSRSDMLRVAECESNLDPYAVNPSGSYGLFQFIRSTWKSTPYGNKDIFDPEANANAAAWMWSEGRKSEWVCQ